MSEVSIEADPRFGAIVVTGSRYATDPECALFTKKMALAMCPHGDPLYVYHGGASGVDLLVANGLNHEPFKIVEVKADWTQHGKAAGPLRNKKMVDLAARHNIVLMVAFPMRGKENRGTIDCINHALKHPRGIPINVRWINE